MINRLPGVLPLILCLGLLAACGKEEATAGYDPRIDGVVSHPATPVDQSILGDQKALHPAPRASTPAVAATTRPAAASAPAVAATAATPTTLAESTPATMPTTPTTPATVEAATIPAAPATIAAAQTMPATMAATMPVEAAATEAAPGKLTLDDASGQLILANGTHIPPPPSSHWQKRTEDSFVSVVQGGWKNVSITAVDKSYAGSNDQAKLVYAQATYKDDIKTLGDAITGLKSTPPKLEPGPPARATYTFEGKMQDTIAVSGKAIIVYAGQTYLIQAMAGTAAELTDLLKVADAIPPAEPATTTPATKTSPTKAPSPLPLPIP